MGQSLVQNYIHIVFSTKHRQPLIGPSIEKDLHGYISGTCKSFGCPAIKVGGYVDHVHILCKLSSQTTLSSLVQKIKSNSSRWVKTKDSHLSNFFWQSGYGAFSVNYKNVQIVSNYIENQHKHHDQKTFKNEYLGFLEKHQIEFDDRYVWD